MVETEMQNNEINIYSYLDYKEYLRDLYEAYRRWTEEAGRSKMGRTRVYEEIRRAFSDCSRSKVRSDSFGTNPVWVFRNIEIQSEYSTGYS